MDSKEDKPERPASDPAEAALEKQRELLAAATARLRARIDKAPPRETGPGADEQAGAASAGSQRGESEEPPPAGREPSSAPPEEVADGATVEMIVERAHRLVRVSREAKRASPQQPVPPPASTPPAPATDDAPTRPAPDGEDEVPAGDAAERAPAEPAAAKAAPAAEPPNATPPAAPAPTVAPKPPHRSSPPWLPRALREMAVREPTDAGRLFLALLPAHGLVESRDLRYDLVLGDTGCLAVDLVAGGVTISEQLTPRPASEVDFQVSTSLAGLGVAVAGGRVSRLMTRERVRVIPDRRQLDTLRLLAQAPLGLQTLHSVGVRLDPMLAYRALTGSIEPQWTASHHFTLLHEVAGSPAHRCCVHVDGERPVSVISPVARQLNATMLVRCPPEHFLPLLSGELTRAEEQALVHGEIDALTALQDWIARIEWSGAYGG